MELFTVYIYINSSYILSQTIYNREKKTITQMF
jgi:hypothetical protein